MLSKRNLFVQLFPNQIKPYDPTCCRCLSLFHISIYSLCVTTRSFESSLAYRVTLEGCDCKDDQKLYKSDDSKVLFSLEP